ncbi:MAG: hypothetical protein U0835_11950 [Isosphaeraceae bacterium]
MQSHAVTNDGSGNVYVTGSFVGTTDFDPGAGTTYLNATGGARRLLRPVQQQRHARLGGRRSAGPTFNWASVAEGAAIVVDGSGNVIVAGTFTGTVNFDPNAGNTSLSAPGRNDAFIAKYDASGNLVGLLGRGLGRLGRHGLLARDRRLRQRGGRRPVPEHRDIRRNHAHRGGRSRRSSRRSVPQASSSGRRRPPARAPRSRRRPASVVDALGNVVSTGFYAGQVDLDPGAGVQAPANAGSARRLRPEARRLGTSSATAVGSTDIDPGNLVAFDTSGNVYVTGTSPRRRAQPGRLGGPTPGGSRTRSF